MQPNTLKAFIAAQQHTEHIYTQKYNEALAKYYSEIQHLPAIHEAKQMLSEKESDSIITHNNLQENIQKTFTQSLNAEQKNEFIKEYIEKYDDACEDLTKARRQFEATVTNEIQRVNATKVMQTNPTPFEMAVFGFNNELLQKQNALKITMSKLDKDYLNSLETIEKEITQEITQELTQQKNFYFPLKEFINEQNNIEAQYYAAYANTIQGTSCAAKEAQLTQSVVKKIDNLQNKTLKAALHTLEGTEAKFIEQYINAYDDLVEDLANARADLLEKENYEVNIEAIDEEYLERMKEAESKLKINFMTPKEIAPLLINFINSINDSHKINSSTLLPTENFANKMAKKPTLSTMPSEIHIPNMRMETEGEEFFTIIHNARKPNNHAQGSHGR